MHILWILPVALAAFCFGVGGYLFFAACGRGKQLDWLDEQAVKATPHGKYFDSIREGEQWLQDHGAQAVYMRSFDGLMLYGTWVPAPEARATMILAHGYRSCILTDFAVVFDRYHKAGFNLLLPDQRAHRRSEGRFITFGVKESRDFVDWGHFVAEMLSGLPILYSGLSMGASTVMYVAGAPDKPAQTAGFLADCGFTSPAEIMSKVFRQVTRLPAWPFLWAADLFARVFAGFSVRQKDSTRTLKDNTLPILLVHGLADDFVPCEMTRRAFAACGGPKELLLVEGAGHGVSFIKAEKEYWALAQTLFYRALEEKT